MSQDTDHFRLLYDPNYLGSWNIPEGGEIIATIKSYGKEEIPDYTKKKPKNGPQPTKTVVIMRFEEEDLQPFVVNITNATRISEVLETERRSKWIGKRIALHVEQVNAFGKTVSAIRVVPRKVLDKEELTPNHPLWNQAKSRASNKTTTPEAIRKHYNLSDENEKLLFT